MSWVTSIARTASTFAPAVTVAIAFWAANTWQRTLRNQRADECLGAIFELRAAIEDCHALAWEINDDDKINDAILGVRKTSWRRFDQAYAVARRYYPELNVRTLTQLTRIVNSAVFISLQRRHVAPGVMITDTQAQVEGMKDVGDRLDAVVLGVERVLAPRSSLVRRMDQHVKRSVSRYEPVLRARLSRLLSNLPSKADTAVDPVPLGQATPSAPAQRDDV